MITSPSLDLKQTGYVYEYDDDDAVTWQQMQQPALTAPGLAAGRDQSAEHPHCLGAGSA